MAAYSTRANSHALLNHRDGLTVDLLNLLPTGLRCGSGMFVKLVIRNMLVYSKEFLPVIIGLQRADSLWCGVRVEDHCRYAPVDRASYMLSQPDTLARTFTT